MNTRQATGSGKTQRAFTLVELLAVMAIMAILLAVTVPSLSGLNESVNITQGGQRFADQVALARQTASSRNITVQVRCINIPTRSQNGYSAIQLWSATTGTAVSRVQLLPDGMVISQDTTKISTLFASFPTAAATMPTGTSLAGDNYVYFTVSPSGMVGPLGAVVPDMTASTVGILPVRYATSTTLPTNYMLVQLNPQTAATLSYRP